MPDCRRIIITLAVLLPCLAYQLQADTKRSGDRTLGSLTTLALIVTAVFLGFPVNCRSRHNQKEQKEQKEENSQGCTEQTGRIDDNGSAVSCWAQQFGRFKHCGLRPDPVDASIGPPRYSFEPLDLPLPELSEAESASLEEFSRRVAAKFSDKDYRTDKGTLVRFLRGRRFNVDRAERYFCKAMAFWDKMGVREVLDTWNLEAYERCLSPWWLSGGFLGHGRKGEMLAYERLSRCNWPKLVANVPWHHLEKLDIVHCLRSLAACEEDSLRTGIPLGRGILIQDCDGFGWDQVSLASSVALNKLVELRNTIMPECLSMILVIRAPSSWIYSWKMFKHMLDPGIRDKVKMARPGKETAALLAQYISPDELPAFLGGNKHINGDPQCGQVLAPGGLPPQEALDRFFDLVQNDGSHDNFADDNARSRAFSGASVDSVASRVEKRAENSCGVVCPRRMGCSS